MKRPLSQRTPARPGGCVGVAALVAVLLFSGTMITTVVALAIWPGEVKLVAPLFCDDAQPDAFVVADTYSPAPGETTTNYTLYCMGPDGDATDHGFLLPFLATVALNTLLLVAIGVFMGMVRRLRAKRIGRTEPAGFDERLTGPATTAGPFVD